MKIEEGAEKTNDTEIQSLHQYITLDWVKHSNVFFKLLLFLSSFSSLV